MIRVLLSKALTVCIILGFLCTTSDAEHRVRVATYNIRFLDAAKLPNQGDRREKLQKVIDELDADVIALQEIDDRAALEKIFDRDKWFLIIDDDSGDNQDVALAVRKPFRIRGIGADLKAEPKNFLFPKASDNSAFPKRRDVLVVEVVVPDGDGQFFVMVVHAKSRFGGRAKTEPRRTRAARRLVQTLERDFDEKDFIVLGDFNDHPDDRSMNILETGDASAVGGPEENPGPFLINLTEALGVRGYVSLGRTSRDIENGRINTIDPQSRRRNNEHRGTNFNTGDILFDQILVPSRLNERYVADSVAVFDGPIAVRGNSRNRASDHLPVYAEFVFSSEDGDDSPVDGVRIVSLLPNPTGPDAGNESVTLKNFSSAAVSLKGWVLRDRAGNEFALSGSLAAGSQRIVQLPAGKLPLNNSGDRILLIGNDGSRKDRVEYTRSQAGPGSLVTFQ